MTSPGTALIPKSTITEVVAHRDRALELYDQFFDAVESAHEILAEAREQVRLACGGQLSKPYYDDNATEVKEFEQAVKPPTVDAYKRVARRLTDIMVWTSLIERTELEHLMDKTAKDQLRDQMQYIPEKVHHNTGQVINQEEIAKSIPEVTEENILATIEGFRHQASDIWRRGVAVAFTNLDRRFRSHDGFKIGSRVILSRAFDEFGSWSYYSRHRETLVDIERVFLVLDGKSPRAVYGGIVGIIDNERRNNRSLSRHQSEHEGDYFLVRVFKNGNAHLWFTRKDLVEKVNKVLAEYYGAGLGWGKQSTNGHDPEASFSGAVERSPARNFGLFETPDDLADRVIEEAKLWSAQDQKMRVLEPSAGSGQLASRASELGHQVTVVEVQPELAAVLRAQGEYGTVNTRDFLELNPFPIYDRVIMNPPFDRGRDIDHVHHAIKFLKPGGRLVAIMSASTEFAQTKKAESFRKEVRQHRGKFRDLPLGSFRECGTNVNTVLLTLEKRDD